MTAVGLDRIGLLELQAALLAGAGAAEAVAATCRDGVLALVARDTRLGRPLDEVAADIDTGDPAADLLVRALALGERTGGGAADAVEQALDVIEEEAALRRLVAVRTAQARGTAVILAAVPAAIWLLLMALDISALRFYATPLGAVSGAGAVLFALAGWRWMHRLVQGAAGAADRAEPLAPPPAPPAWRRGAAVGAVPGLVGLAVGGVAVGIGVAAVVAIAVARRCRAQPPPAAGGAAEVVDLVAVTLGAGMAVPSALAEVSRLAPKSARGYLHAAARRTAGGWGVDEALDDTPLAPLGAALAAVGRWGTPAAPALRRLARELRAERRVAAELAAERLQLSLVFPTTLLTLPAFVLGVVPPLLWSTLRG